MKWKQNNNWDNTKEQGIGRKQAEQSGKLRENALMCEQNVEWERKQEKRQGRGKMMVSNAKQLGEEVGKRERCQLQQKRKEEEEKEKKKEKKEMKEKKKRKAKTEKEKAMKLMMKREKKLEKAMMREKEEKRKEENVTTKK